MKIAILIQSNDDYDFLWEGLFLSWKLNWNWEEFNFPLFLITETKQFSQSHPDCDFKTINVGNDLSGPKNYSNKLLVALQKLKKEGYTHILYSQDDSWAFTQPDTAVIKGCLKMFEEKNMDCFYIHEQKWIFPFTYTPTTEGNIKGHRVRKFQSGSRFYYNHGNAIWNIDSLLKIQKEDEGPYENEAGSTSRAWDILEKVYMVNIPWYDQDVVHEKGKIKESGEHMVRNLRFRYAWETEQNSFIEYIANDGSKIPLSAIKDNSYGTHELDKIREVYNTSYNGGAHFSYEWRYFSKDKKTKIKKDE